MNIHVQILRVYVYIYLSTLLGYIEETLPTRELSYPRGTYASALNILSPTGTLITKL